MKKKWLYRQMAAGLTATLLLSGTSLPAYAAGYQGTFGGSNTAAQKDSLSAAEQEQLQQILDRKTVMATVYLTDEYAVRSNPDSTAEVMAELPSGSQVLIRGAKLAGDTMWYEVTFAVDDVEHCGYIEAAKLVSADLDFRSWEEQAAAHGENAEDLVRSGNEDILSFPESYRTALVQLKAAHPNWTFVPMRTNLNWSDVVSAEMQNNRSWVYKTKGDAWKAGPAAQNGWYIASRSAVEYCLDPRNFTKDTYIFMFEQLTYNAQNHTEAAVQNILSGSFMEGEVPGEGITYAKAFYNIGSSLGVSPFHLASRVYQEQGKAGTSPLISGTYPGYEGYYNYYNIGASGGSAESIYVNGLTTAKNRGWDTRMKSLSGGAEFISQNYILKGQDTLYLQKFDVDASYNGLYSHQYQQNITAPMSEGLQTRTAYNRVGALENPFVFKIPVYNNMPATACPSPDSGNSTSDAVDPDTIPDEQAQKLRAFVIRLYQDALGRTSYQDSEIDYWYDALRKGDKTGAEVAQGFFFSDEFRNKGLSNADYIEVLYKVMFDRTADEGGKDNWMAKLNMGMSREYVYRGFANSQEFANVCSQYGVIQGSVTLGSYRDQNEGVTSFVNRLYNKLLDRQGEDDGIENWCKTILTKADTTENVAHGFVYSQEFLNRKTSNEDFVKIMYRTFLDREYDEAGLEDWVGRLNGGTDREEVFRGFARSTEFHELMKAYGVE